MSSSITRPRRAVTLACAMALLFCTGWASPASADSVTFDYTADTQFWQVPAGVTSIVVDAYGAAGADLATRWDGPILGGRGGRAMAVVSVSPGEFLWVNVGGHGYAGGCSLAGSCSTGWGGWNGGGVAPDLGAGGGGASDIRRNSAGIAGGSVYQRVVVAGGGGGAGYADACGSGGPGGGESGGVGCPTGGGGATQSGGGAADCGDVAYDPPRCGSTGSFATGGSGNASEGSGGGGGWYGGGGSGQHRPGGGGSGLGPPGTAYERGVRSGHGQVVISYPVRALGITTAGSGAGYVDGLGVDCGRNVSGHSDCDQAYGDAATVTLTAHPEANNVLAGWSGACSGTAPTCTVTMDQARSVIATFEPGHNLSVATDGTGAGFVDSSPAGIDCGRNVSAHAACEHGFVDGTAVTLTAHPNANTDFAGWSGASCSGTALTCTVTIDQAYSVTATFTLKQRTLSVGAIGTGVGRIDSFPTGIDCGHNFPGHTDCDQSYADGTSVTLTAHPDAFGTNFAGWSGGGCSGTTPTCTVTMDQARSVAATFTLKPGTLQLTIAGAGGGFVDTSPTGVNCGRNVSGVHADCEQLYSGQAVTMTAHPAPNSDFAGWSGGGCSGTALTCTVTMNQTRFVTATFTIKQPPLTVAAGGTGAGVVDSSPSGIDCGRNVSGHADCDQNYTYGTAVTLTARPEANTDFAGWSGGGCSGTATTCRVTMDQARSVTATFTLKQRALAVTTDGTGSGFVDSSPAGIDCGRNVGGHGDCDDSYADGTSVTLTAHPDANTDFAGWSGGACPGTATACTVTMDQARSVTVAFTLKQRGLAVTTAGSGAGVVDSSPAGIDCGRNVSGHADCDDSQADGTSVTLTARPEPNTDFAGWSGSGCSGTGTTCIVALDQARSVTATFTLKQRALTVTTDGTGSGFVDSAPTGVDCGRNVSGHADCDGSYADGTDVTLTAHPDGDTHFAGWSGDGCSGSVATCTVTMEQVRSVTARFTAKDRAPETPQTPNTPATPQDPVTPSNPGGQPNDPAGQPNNPAGQPDPAPADDPLAKCQPLKGAKRSQCIAMQNAKQRYASAVAKCQKLKGAKKSACVKKAKAAYRRATARAKCMTLTGTRKKSCTARAARSSSRASATTQAIVTTTGGS